MNPLRWSSLSRCGLLAAASLLLAACSPSEPETAPAPAPAKPAAKAPAQAKAPKPTAVPLLVDELYVDAEAEPDEGTPPLIVMFSSLVEDHTGDYTCQWDFGDGTARSTELNPKHTYEKEGDFIVTLVCKDSRGIEGETEIDVTVYEYD